jgi:hypothetical protein
VNKDGMEEFRKQQAEGFGEEDEEMVRRAQPQFRRELEQYETRA